MQKSIGLFSMQQLDVIQVENILYPFLLETSTRSYLKLTRQLVDVGLKDFAILSDGTYSNNFFED